MLLSGQAEAVATWSADKRFKDNGDKTITDTKTSLMWMKEDSYLHSGHWVNWFESIQFIIKPSQVAPAGPISYNELGLFMVP